MTAANPLVALAAGLALLAAACGDAAVDGAPGGGATGAESERLTIEDVRAFARARTALAEVAAQDSSAWRALEPLAPGERPYASLEEAVEALERHPRISEALGAAGVSARDYVLTRFALQQALLAHDVRRAGGEDAPIPASIPDQNLELVAEHRSEIESLLAHPPRVDDDAPEPGG